MEAHNHYTAMPVPLAKAISEIVEQVERSTKKIVGDIDVTIEGCSFRSIRVEFIHPARRHHSACLPEEIRPVNGEEVARITEPNPQ